jgi:hypothetical protein
MRALAATLFVVMPAAKTAKAATMVASLLTVIPFRLCRPAETSAQRDHPQIRCCEPSQIKQPVAMVTIRLGPEYSMIRVHDDHRRHVKTEHVVSQREPSGLSSGRSISMSLGSRPLPALSGPPQSRATNAAARTQPAAFPEAMSNAAAPRGGLPPRGR